MSTRHIGTTAWFQQLSATTKVVNYVNPSSQGFQTEAGVFDWTLLAFTNNSLVPGTKAEFTPYTGQTFDSCDIGIIGLTLSLSTFSLSGQAYIQCFGTWPIFAKTTFEHSMDAAQSSVLSGSAATSALAIDTPSKKIQTDIAYTMMDLWIMAQLRSTRVAGLSELGFSVSTLDPRSPQVICPKEFNTPDRGCNTTRDYEKPRMQLVSAFVGYTNGSFTVEEDQLVQQPLVTAINNYLTVVHAAVRYDLADIRPNNLFTNPSLASQYLDTADETQGIFPGATVIIESVTSLIQQQAVSVKTEFLCQVKQLKSPASFIFAVAGLALSNFAALWGAVILILTFIHKRRDKTAMACEMHKRDAASVSLGTHASTVPILPFVACKDTQVSAYNSYTNPQSYKAVPSNASNSY